MKAKMHVTPDARSLAREVVTDVRDAEEAARHARAAARYREERRNSGSWWIDLGGEGEPCG
jgi:hypothetical protein